MHIRVTEAPPMRLSPVTTALLELENNVQHRRAFRAGVVLLHVFFTFLLLTPDPYATTELFHSLRDVKFEGYFIHLGVYFGLALTVRCAVFDAKSERFAVAYISAHALLSEYGQSFVPGRTCDPWDSLANTLGVGLAMICYHLLIRGGNDTTMATSSSQ